MRIVLRRVAEFQEDRLPSKWLDEDLDNDGVDLEEWAFWQGYYNEE